MTNVPMFRNMKVIKEGFSLILRHFELVETLMALFKLLNSRALDFASFASFFALEGRMCVSRAPPSFGFLPDCVAGAGGKGGNCTDFGEASWLIAEASPEPGSVIFRLFSGVATGASEDAGAGGAPSSPCGSVPCGSPFSGSASCMQLEPLTLTVTSSSSRRMSARRSVGSSAKPPTLKTSEVSSSGRRRWRCLTRSATSSRSWGTRTRKRVPPAEASHKTLTRMAPN